MCALRCVSLFARVRARVCVGYSECVCVIIRKCMHVYICVCVCMYVYRCVYVYTCIRRYAWVYACVCMGVRMCMLVYVCVSVSVRLRVTAMWIRSCDPNSVTEDPDPIRICTRYGPDTLVI